jgi:hypothetical protein
MKFGGRTIVNAWLEDDSGTTRQISIRRRPSMCSNKVVLIGENNKKRQIRLVLSIYIVL